MMPVSEKFSSVGCPTNTPIIMDDQKRRFVPHGTNKPCGEYQIAIDERGYYGWCVDYRIGVFHAISEFDKTKSYTQQQIEEFKKRADESRKKREIERNEKLKIIASESARAWRSSIESDHPYLIKKQITKTGTRVFQGGEIAGKQYGRCLLVPVFKDGAICNLQLIFDDGFKMFIPDSTVKGAYTAFADKDEDKSKIIICEGFATGASIRLAIQKPVIVAFNAYNMEHVADEMRRKYPNSEIVIAADNDQWTEINGKKTNVGMIRAKTIAARNKAKIVYPDFSPSEQSKPTDFNDLHIMSGLDAVKAAFADEVVLREPENEDWKMQLIYKDHKLDKTNLRNAYLFLLHHEKFKNKIRYNEFNKKFMYIDEDAHLLDDDDIQYIRMDLQDMGIISTHQEIVRQVGIVAKERKFNPAMEYFESLSWDGKRRLDKWLIEYFSAAEAENGYLEFIGKKWLTAAVSRVYRAGTKFDQILVIEGTQGIGKSFALRTLATFGDEEESYFTDSVTIESISNKDAMQLTNGKIIVELAEMVGMNKKDDDELKRWITLNEDEARLPYDKHPVVYPRMFVLAGTTNKTDYLKDPTGNRRYWPFRAMSIDHDALRRDREQLWAEAVHWFKEGLQIWPTKEEEAIACREQSKRLTSDPWDRDVREAIGLINTIRPFHIDDVMRKMQIGLHHKDSRTENRIRAILSKLGYKQEFNQETNEYLWRM